MTSLKIKVDDKVLEKVLWLLSYFTKDEDEVEIDRDDLEFIKNKAAIKTELDRMKKGEAEYITEDEMTAQVNDMLAKYETKT